MEKNNFYSSSSFISVPPFFSNMETMNVKLLKINSIATIKKIYGLIPWNNCGISITLVIIFSELKNNGSVSPMANKVNGMTFAVSAEALYPYLGI